MKNRAFLLLAALLATLLAFTLTCGFIRPHAAAPRETAYARVIRTGALRCGYAIFAPFMTQNPNTGGKAGISYDYVESLGRALNIKVEWAEEMGWGDFPAALESRRIDAFCTGVWPTAARALRIDFVRPIVYQPIYAYVRATDRRFDNNLNALNAASTTLVTMDGEMSALIAAADFPHAHRFDIPQLSTIPELLEGVATGKGDVTFTDVLTAADYHAHNPGKIRRVETPAPLRIFGVSLAIAHGQDELRRMLDIATEEMLLDGQMEKIIAAHEPKPGTLLRAATFDQTANRP